MRSPQIAAGRFGDLDCLSLSGRPGDAVRSLVVVLCHGYGAPGDDLVPIASEIFRAFPELEEQVRFVFPAAPNSLEGGYGPHAARAWWPLDDRALEATLSRGEPLDTRRAAVPEVAGPRGKLTALVDEILAAESLPPDRLILGGFSQGAMLATDTALHLPASPAALCIFSGAPLNQDEWRDLARARAGMPVVQSHGRQDALLSFAAAVSLRDLLRSAGLEVRFLPFDGPHTIPPEGIGELVAIIRGVVGSS